MPKLDLKSFLTDPAHKERRDFLSGVIDARVKELIAERKKSKEKSDDENDGDKNKDTTGNIFDEIFGSDDE